ncbi:MAG: glycosyl transferase [Crocinitomicaceae bacterium]|nr:glycosyl transferase [Crocinitomicaceae bacterium]
MKVLYAIQGTGNGHLSRAEEIVPLLNKHVDTTVLVSGTQSQIQSNFEIHYKKTGLTFLNGKNGNIDLLRTVFKTHPIDFLNEIRTFPVRQFDLVITDFEPVSAWSALMHGVPCIEMSHQAGVIHPKSPKTASNNRIGKYILNHNCPTKHKVGFHFDDFADNIYTPVIRGALQNIEAQKQDFYTVYLPAFHDDVILHFLQQFPVKWEVFSKYTTLKQIKENVTFHPIDQENFQKHLINCKGVLCGAGFELPSEALYLKKKLLVIPMKGHYEQQCNAAVLEKMGVSVIESLNLVHHRTINLWLSKSQNVEVNYKNQTEKIILDTLTEFEKRSIIFEENDLQFEKSMIQKLSVLKYLF